MKDIVQNVETGNWFYISSVPTMDAGLETMIFRCSGKDAFTGRTGWVDWFEVYSEHYDTVEQMNARHEELVKLIKTLPESKFEIIIDPEEGRMWINFD